MESAIHPSDTICSYLWIYETVDAECEWLVIVLLLFLFFFFDCHIARHHKIQLAVKSVAATDMKNPGTNVT